MGIGMKPKGVRLRPGIVSNISGLDMQSELMTGWLNSSTFISTPDGPAVCGYRLYRLRDS